MSPWAFNQGFYNLFLAIGTVAGAIVWIAGKATRAERWSVSAAPACWPPRWS